MPSAILVTSCKLQFEEVTCSKSDTAKQSLSFPNAVHQDLSPVIVSFTSQI